MRTLLLFLFLFLISGCDNANDNKQTSPIITKRYIQDKKDVSKSLIESIEFIRLSAIQVMRWMENDMEIKKRPYERAEDRISPPLERYITTYSSKTDSYMPCPYPINKKLSVYTDSIFYSPDSLLAVAIVCLQRHREKNEMHKGEEKYEFDSMAFVCYRDSINDKFKIYPIQVICHIYYDNRKEAVDAIVYDYTKKRKKQPLTVPSVHPVAGTPFKAGIDKKEFFESEFLKMNKKYGKYNFQLFDNGYYDFKQQKGIDDVREYKYFGNQPDSIKKQWMELVKE